MTELLRAGSVVTVLLGRAWWGGRIGWAGQKNPRRTALIGALEVEYADGSRENVLTDARWRVMTTPILFSSIDGETVDMNAPCGSGQCGLFAYDKSVLIPQEGEIVREKLTLQPRAEFVTPAGERVLDFGQNMTGYVRIHARAQRATRSSFPLRRCWTRTATSTRKTCARPEQDPADAGRRGRDGLRAHLQLPGLPLCPAGSVPGA